MAGLLDKEHALRLAGAQSMTLAPAVLQELSKSSEPEDSLRGKSIFNQVYKEPADDTEPITYVDNQSKWREAFVHSNHGTGAAKTKDVRFSCSHIASPLLTLVTGYRHLL